MLMRCIQIPSQAGSTLVFLSLYPNVKADLAASQKREDAFPETATSVIVGFSVLGEDTCIVSVAGNLGLDFWVWGRRQHRQY